MNSSVYKEIVLGSISRLLSLLDRNPFSPNYGSFDRSFWHYREKDYPGALYQEGGLTLALLYAQDFEGNLYYRRSEILRWAVGSISYWCRIQNSDGSFNEWYPNEHSFVATAFTTYAVSESYLILRDFLPEGIPDKLLIKLRKAGKWLSANDDLLVMNHVAGSIPALQNLYLITGDEGFKREVQRKLGQMVNDQREEGWFTEYGGADPAYLGLTVDFLAKYYKKTGDADAFHLIKKAIGFMRYFIHPDGTFGGEYGSRNAKYLVPHGLEIMAGEVDEAKKILEVFYSGLGQRDILTPATMDDRYFPLFLNRYLQAFGEVRERETRTAPQGSRKIGKPQWETRFFEEAGLLTVKTDSYYAVIGISKNGVIKVFSLNPEGPQLIFDDAGYFCIFNHDKVASSQWLNMGFMRNLDMSLEDGGNESHKASLEAGFVRVNYSLSLTKMLIPFRIFNYSIGKIKVVAQIINSLIKRVVISRQKRAPIRLERSITLDNQEVIIKDDLRIFGNCKIKRLGIEKDVTTMHVPSSRYFQSVEIESKGNLSLNSHYIDILNNKKNLRIERRICVREGQSVLTTKIEDKIFSDNETAEK